MKSNLKFFKKVRSLPVDQFFQNVLYSDEKSNPFLQKQKYSNNVFFVIIGSPPIKYESHSINDVKNEILNGKL